MTPEATAVDTSLLVRPTARRFLMAAWERRGARVPVLPHVLQELFGVMASRERTYWVRFVEGQERRQGIRYSSAVLDDILRAASAATQTWVRDTLDAQKSLPEDALPNSALRVVRLSKEQTGRAGRVANQIPAWCFHGRSLDEHDGDRNVIAEAAVGGFRVLCLDNRRSIQTEHMNSWLRKEFRLNGDLLRTPRKTISMLFGDGPDGDVDSLKSVLRACLPDNPVSSQREAAIVGQFLSRLVPAGLKQAAEGARRIWQSPLGPELVDAARSELPGSLARATEERQYTAVQRAVVEAGLRMG